MRSWVLAKILVNLRFISATMLLYKCLNQVGVKAQAIALDTAAWETSKAISQGLLTNLDASFINQFDRAGMNALKILVSKLAVKLGSYSPHGISLI